MRIVAARALRVAAVAVFVTWAFMLFAVIGTATNADAAEFDGGANPTQSVPRLEQRRDTRQTSVAAVSSGVMCPTCDTTLDQSDSPAAERMRVWVDTAVRAGWTQDEIRDGLVREYGGDESILAVPRASGLGLAVWIVPALLTLGALLTGALVVRRWRRDAQLRSASSSYSQDALSSSEAVESHVPSASPADDDAAPVSSSAR